MTTPVLIVGAGPTGLTMACELLRRGVACRIIDQSLEASPFSKALAIHARTLELFEKMGVIDPFLEHGWPLEAFNVYSRTKHLVRMTFQELESPYPFVLSLPQSETERILSEHLAKLGGKIEWGTTLASLQQHGERVEARLDLAGGGHEDATAHWVVGCDGAHSTVRHALGIPFEGSKYEERYVLADVEYDTTLDTSEFYIFSDRHRLAGFHPFSSIGARIFADIDLRPDGEIENVTLGELQQYLDDRGPGLVKLKKIRWLSTFHVHRRQARSYRAGRIFLAGDAAHVHSPAGGQGMNVGIQDAFNLAWKLALVEDHGAQEVLLDSYGLERHSAGRGTLRMTDFFSKINTLQNPLARVMRDYVGPIISRNEKVRLRYRNAVTQLSVHYRDSPIVGQQLGQQVPDGTPLPGDRAPDGDLIVNGQPSRLFDLMRDPRHHLLVFAGEDVTATRAEWAGFENDRLGVHIICDGRLGKSASAIESDGALHRRYGAAPSALYLIRPDGYISHRSLPANREALRKHLESTLATSTS